MGPLKCLRFHSLVLLIRMRLRARVEWPVLATLIHPTIRRVAERRSWAFVRELKAVVGAQDFLVPVDCVLGLPMLGPACQGPNFPPATKDAACTVEDLWVGIDEHNAPRWRSRPERAARCVSFSAATTLSGLPVPSTTPWLQMPHRFRSAPSSAHALPNSSRAPLRLLGHGRLSGAVSQQVVRKFASPPPARPLPQLAPDFQCLRALRSRRH